MTKKTSTEVAANANPRTAGNWEITDADLSAAQQLGIDLEGSVSGCMARAASAANEAALRAVEAGYLMLRVKSEVGHGEFDAALEEIGMSSQRASEFMRMARFTSLMPADKRASLVSLGKSRILALAGADQQIIDSIIEDGVGAVNELSVRELRERIRELEASVADRDVQIETAEAEAKAAQKAASKVKDRASEVPVVIYDIRAEAVAQAEKARLAVDEFSALGRDLVMLIGMDGVYQWVTPTARLAVAGMLALRVQLDGEIKRYLDAFEMEDIQPEPMSYLVPSEVEDAARKFSDLTALHQHEKALRDWERQQERPRGKGRPAAKPDAPKTLSAD